MKYIIFITFILFFYGCATDREENIKVHHKERKNNIVKKKVDLRPYWMYSNFKLDEMCAIGYAKPVFQGVYMQRQNAFSDAKIEIANKINSRVTSKKSTKVVIFDKEINTKSIEESAAFNRLIIQDLYQKDAYIDKEGGLNLLVCAAKRDKYIKNYKKNLKRYSNNLLLQSKCYNKKQLESMHTKALFYKGKPIWFYEPENGTIGIAKQTSSNFEQQKKTAILLAKSNLIKKIRSKNISKLKLLQISSNNKSGLLYDISALQRSNAKIDAIRVEDIWMDPKTCELYVWIYSSSR